MGILLVKRALFPRSAGVHMTVTGKNYNYDGNGWTSKVGGLSLTL